MNRAACVMAMLVLAAGSASADQAGDPAKPSATATRLTPQQVLAMVKADGARDTVLRLVRNGAWEASVLPGIATGQLRWIDAAVALREGSDAGGSEDLEDALSEALLVQPYVVLPRVKDDWLKYSVPVCSYGWDSELPGGVEPYVLKLRAALDRTPPPELASLREACLRGIEQTLKEVHENEGK